MTLVAGNTARPPICVGKVTEPDTVTDISWLGVSSTAQARTLCCHLCSVLNHADPTLPESPPTLWMPPLLAAAVCLLGVVSE